MELGAKGKINHNQLKTLISGIAAFVAKSVVVHPKESVIECRDEEDNMLLECCLESHAKYLITGDKDLLHMDNIPFKLKVLTPREFIEIDAI